MFLSLFPLFTLKSLLSMVQVLLFQFWLEITCSSVFGVCVVWVRYFSIGTVGEAGEQCVTADCMTGPVASSSFLHIDWDLYHLLSSFFLNFEVKHFS